MNESNRLLSASLAKSTHATYMNCVNKFMVFRGNHSMGQSWPVSPQIVISFIAFMSISGWAPSTIFTHISAIAFIHKLNFWLDPTDCFVIRKLREGLRRQGRGTDTRHPITYRLLGRLIDILPSVCRSAYEVSLFRAAFLLSFFGFLRVGELACASKKADTSRVISSSDVSFVRAGLVVIIRYSKTDQRGVSVPLYFHSAVNSNWCPVAAVSQFMQCRAQIGGPLFIHFNREPLTRYQFTSVLKRGVRVLGLSPDNYGSHSFRIGAATSAAMCGLSDNEIQSLGRWKSSAFKIYIRPGLLDSLF